MGKLAFIGGVVIGAAGLLGAALWDKKKTESQFSPSLKISETLDAVESSKQLNSYFCKAQDIYCKCNEVVMNASSLIATPISLPDDDILEKAKTFIGGHGNRWLRGHYENQLKDMRKELKNLYGRYKGVFEQANQLICKNGEKPLDLTNLKFSSDSILIDPALENENWFDEFEVFADSITNFIENTCKAAEQLIDLLTGKNQNQSLVMEQCS